MFAHAFIGQEFTEQDLLGQGQMVKDRVAPDSRREGEREDREEREGGEGEEREKKERRKRGRRERKEGE